MTTVAGDRQARGDVHFPWDRAAWRRQWAGGSIVHSEILPLRGVPCDSGTAAPDLGLPVHRTPRSGSCGLITL